MSLRIVTVCEVRVNSNVGDTVEKDLVKKAFVKSEILCYNNKVYDTTIEKTDMKSRDELWHY